MTISGSEAARALARLPRRARPRVCVVCGKAFEGKGRSRYCSRTCQNRADYQRHAAQRRATKRAALERARQTGDAADRPQPR